MKCQKCKKDFLENKIEESHDIPCYLFSGNRKGQKNQADKFSRHNLCNKCHKNYEYKLGVFLKQMAQVFAKKYFKNDTKTT